MRNMESQDNIIYNVEHPVIKSEPVDNDDEVTPLREESVCSLEPAFANNCDSGWNTDDEGSFESQPNDILLEVFKEETRDDLDLDFLDDLSLPGLENENLENQTMPSEPHNAEDVTQEDVTQEDVIQKHVIQKEVIQEDFIQETIAAGGVTNSISENGLHRDPNFNVRTKTYKRELHFRIHIRGLHSSTSSDWISFELFKLGHTVCRVKSLVNEFQVDLLPNNNNRNILNVTKLDIYKVSIRLIPYQCHRCNLFDHRLEDCVLQGYICFKCAGSHHFSQCPKPREKHGKCCNCGANHLANFHGCPVYKDALKMQLMNRFIEHANQDLPSYISNNEHSKHEQDNSITNKKLSFNKTQNKRQIKTSSPSAKRQRTDESSTGKASTKPTKKRLYKVPNIFIPNVKDGHSLIQQMIATLGQGSFGIKTFTKGTNFQCFTMEKHRALIKKLKDLKYNFRIQETFRMVIKGLNPYTSPDWIAGKLNNLGHAVQHVENIIDETTNHPTSNFNVDFLPNANSSIVNIMKITMLDTYIVTIEQPHFRNQCKRCQRFGHSFKDCWLQGFICVKCAGTHPSSECTKPREEDARCANCGANHMATYTGCLVYKSFVAMQQKSSNTPHTHPTPPPLMSIQPFGNLHINKRFERNNKFI